MLQIIQMTLNGKLNAVACDDLITQNGGVVAVDAVSMVSGCHAGDVDFGAGQPDDPHYRRSGTFTGQIMDNRSVFKSAQTDAADFIHEDGT